jgi:GNAT superfamily N-acetyltransferase
MRTDEKQGTAVEVRRLEAAAADDAGLVDHLTRLVNDVYAIAERGLWRDGWTRTTTSQTAELVSAEEIVVASLDGEVIGSIRIHDLNADTSEFGMLVAAHEHRNSGVGRALVDFAERETRERGLQAMRLELLVPRTWSHPSKEFLKAWYGRRGYRLIGSRNPDEAHPQIAPLLATPCDFTVYEKPLRSAAGS